MRLLKWAFSLLLVFLLYSSSYSQNDSCNIRISLLTCGPGEDLYSLFGHSALRITDPSLHSDIIYNYGTFDFEDPDFYVKFVKGKLLYYVNAEEFRKFVYSYQLENRYVIEQILRLTCKEKHQLIEGLRINALEQNKYYLYEFLFDNCSTRLRDIVRQNTDDSVKYKQILPNPPPTFRNLLYEYLDKGKQYWSKFGIDLLLASRIDRKVINEEAMFLPDYLMKGFDSTVLRNGPMIESKKIILPSIPANEENTFTVTPMMVTISLLVLGIQLIFLKSNQAQNVSNLFDVSFFLVLGLLGCLILFMWFGTEHELCRDNYNLLWALPTHFIIAFFVGSSKPVVKKYFLVTSIVCLLTLIAWPFIPQGLNAAFFPLVMLAGIRSAFRAFKK